MALYMLGFISYGATLVFYAALFPRLARNTPHARTLREKYEQGEISAEEYEREESLEKNRISNISTVRIFCGHNAMLILVSQAHSNIGYLFVLLIDLRLVTSSLH